MADPRPELQWIAEQQGASRTALLHLAQINSGSFNADGVAAVADALEPHFAPLAGPGERIELAAYTSTADDGSLRAALHEALTMIRATASGAAP